MSLALRLYRAATALLEPLAPAALRARARRGKEAPRRLGERLGRASAPRPAGPLLWLHGVSVGETASLLPLVQALRQRRPDLAILVTSGTVTSAQLLARRMPDGVIHQFAPVDAPGAVRRFLDHWRPDLGVLVESELWPNLILSAEARGVPLALISARMTERSARGWRRAPAAARRLFSAFRLTAAQDRSTEDRLRSLGAAPGPQLNLKRLGEPLPADARDLERLRGAVAGRQVVLAASTHPGEEALVVDALRDLDCLLVLAPRHPERGAELAQAFGAARRSAGQLPASGARLYVADTLGELGLFFRLADVVIMGGAFAPKIGGHNPLEPARLGKGVITGPHAFNAAELYAEMQDHGAAITVADAAQLREVVGGLLRDPARQTALDCAARAWADGQTAELDRTMAALAPLLPA